MVAFDYLRSAPRTFRCDRILTAEMTGTHFRLLPKEEFQLSLDGNNLPI
ncbi:MAG: hypothetical protein ACU0CA_14265 [Paracoccaceae bacterium]